MESWNSVGQSTLQSLSNERAPLGQFLEHLRNAIQNLNQGLTTSQEIFQGNASTLKNIQGQLPRLEGGYSFLRDRVAQIQAGMDQNQDLIQNQIDTLESDLDTWDSEWLQEKISTILCLQRCKLWKPLPSEFKH